MTVTRTDADQMNMLLSWLLRRTVNDRAVTDAEARAAAIHLGALVHGVLDAGVGAAQVDEDWEANPPQLLPGAARVIPFAPSVIRAVLADHDCDDCGGQTAAQLRRVTDDQLAAAAAALGDHDPVLAVAIRVFYRQVVADAARLADTAAARAEQPPELGELPAWFRPAPAPQDAAPDAAPADTGGGS